MRVISCTYLVLFPFLAAAQAAYVSSARDACTDACETVMSGACDASSFDQARECQACADENSAAYSAASSWLASCALEEQETNSFPQSGPPPITVVASSPSSRAAFNAHLIVSGLVGMPVIIATAIFSKTVNRDAVFLNFCITWIVFSVSFLLLFFTGQQDQLFPEKTLCEVQATLTYGSEAMAQISTLALVVQFTVRVREIDTQTSGRLRIILTGVLLGFPWLVFIIYAGRMIVDIASLDATSLGSVPAGLVLNDAFFCRTTDMGAFYPIMGIVIAVTVLTLLVEVWIGLWLYSRWRLLRGQQKSALVPVASLVRLFLFTVYGIAVVAIAAAVLQNPRMLPAGDFFQGTMPFAVFIIFGTSSDILSAWATALHLKRKPEPDMVIVADPIESGDWHTAASILESDKATVDAHYVHVVGTRPHSWISEATVVVPHWPKEDQPLTSLPVDP